MILADAVPEAPAESTLHTAVPPALLPVNPVITSTNLSASAQAAKV